MSLGVNYINKKKNVDSNQAYKRFIERIDSAFKQHKHIYLCLYTLADETSDNAKLEFKKTEHAEGVCIEHYKSMRDDNEQRKYFVNISNGTTYDIDMKNYFDADHYITITKEKHYKNNFLKFNRSDFDKLLLLIENDTGFKNYSRNSGKHIKTHLFLVRSNWISYKCNYIYFLIQMQLLENKSHTNLQPKPTVFFPLTRRYHIKMFRRLISLRNKISK